MDLSTIDLKEWQNALVQEQLMPRSEVAEAPASYNARYQGNAIVSMTFDLALSVWDLAEELKEKRKFEVAGQLFRSGTAIGALVREAQNGESLADFVHKMKVALKEADGTEYWLLLCRARNIENAMPCLEHLLPIIKVLNKIISTSEQRSSGSRL